MVNAGWLGSMWSGVFLQTKFTIFQGCPTKQAAFLPEQHGPYNQLLIQPLAFPKMLFCINSWSEGFEILSPFFSEYSFLWLQHFFSLVLVICLSWYLHLKLSHEFYMIYPRTKISNQTYKTTSGIQVSTMGLATFLAQLVSILKAKL